jgi:hypothetical protein
MICLLRNLIPIDIMDNRLPSATDTSLRADLSRIKYYRNKILPCLLTSVLSRRDIKDMGSKLENDFHQIGAVTHNFESGQT